MDALDLSRRLEERYRSYLRTLFYFRDPDLRRSFEDALGQGHIARGPYLEATPVFRRGLRPRELLAESRIAADQGFLRALEADRPLYRHQEVAIRAVLGHQNVVVATGTASGKTEAFLVPILLHLHREFLDRTLCPGVRALVLYPMNALANDQRARLGEIGRRLESEGSPFRFTFGQYIGETPEDEQDSRRYARDVARRRFPGELVFRAEMRATPPHILLTNYSMLEYLLLRPNDSPLFDDGRGRWWTFIILDEAHQYRGSRGIEMGMLLRRLKRRLREGGCTGTFRCIATSATLASGEEDAAAVARFASDLFGEPFRADRVIFGEAEALPVTSETQLGISDYESLTRILAGAEASRDDLAPFVRRLNAALPSGDSLPATLGRLLRADGRARRLMQLIRASPAEVQELVDDLFADVPRERRVAALQTLVNLLVRAEDPDADAPLLTARYHLFLRSLEGAYVSYRPAKKVFLDRRGGSESPPGFEAALCRECGQHYLVGRISGGKFVEAVRDPADPGFGVTFLRPVEDDGDDGADEAPRSKPEILNLCLVCAAIDRKATACGHDARIRVARGRPPGDEDRADQLARCDACGYSASGRDPVREIIHGTDGPNAVVATTLCQNLPESRRKVLAFADGRQEAAFFAWYLEESYTQILNRNLLLKTAQRLASHAPEGLSLRDLAVDLRQILRDRQVLPPSASQLELRRQAWLRIYQEFLTDEPRISLEGVGCVRWSISWPSWFHPPDVLMVTPWMLTEDEAQALVLILLDTLRADRAVELRCEQGIDIGWHDLGLNATQMRVRVGDRGGDKTVRRWDGPAGRRARYLEKLLIKRGLSPVEALERAVHTLRAVWETLRRADERASSAGDRLLLSVADAVRINPEWWRLHLPADTDTVLRCDTCGRLHAAAVLDVCPRHRCPGTLQRLPRRGLESNHYRTLYEEDLPGGLRVEEHTAQLDHEKAREFQREFREGKIHVLSCSTTFELGVDLGDLDVVFLRNVPPEPFNYTQRVGRAGRRARYPGFAVTYCRRAPHDLYHFAEPRRVLEGRTRAPVLSLANEKILTRHVAALTLSAFFRSEPHRFETVLSLLRDFDQPAATADFAAFLHSERTRLEEALRAVVPAEGIDVVGVDDGAWIDRIAGGESRLGLVEAEVASDYRTIRHLEATAAQRGDYRTAAWARARGNTIATEDALSFLSRKVVIPKYGFPVDVVELDTHRTQQSQGAYEISLQRDLSLAISEFAPSSTLIANKKIWTSYALKRVAEREWERNLYKRCARDNVFCRWRPGEPEPKTPCGHQLGVAEYVIPKFGFMTKREEPRQPISRPARIFTTRPYFAGPRGPEPDVVEFPPLSVYKAAPGLMVVLCEGRRGEGFYVCGDCGSGFRKPETTHETPFGQSCRGRLSQVSLGHEFVTDVLQFQFREPPDADIDLTWFAHSLAYALLEGAAESLEVPSTDLNATVSYLADAARIPPIILYDNVPGGAGLVARLEDDKTLLRCLDAAHGRVAGGCGCDEGASCYGCLRSYRNQFAHQHLQRGAVMRYLAGVRAGWPRSTQ
jgi:hypothetical protein